MTQRKQEMEQIRQLKYQKTEPDLNYKQTKGGVNIIILLKRKIGQPPKCYTHGKGVFSIGTQDIRHCGTKSLPKNK